MGKWFAGLVAAIIGGVAVWWITEVLYPKPPSGGSGSSVPIIASFDCRKASTLPERLVCSDHELAELDRRMASLYRDLRQLTNNREGLSSDQISWLKQVRDQCMDVECLKRAYHSRNEWLSNQK